MLSLYAKLCGGTASALAGPLMEIEIVDYIAGLEFRTFFSQSVIIPLLTAIINAIIQAFVGGLFGVV